MVNADLIMTVKEMKNRKNWLDTRMQGIGGSDAAVIMGDNPWKSPYALWLEKTGQAQPEDLSNSEPVYWGTVLEEPVAKRFCEVTGKKVRRAGMMRNRFNSWMLANVDRLVIGEKAGLECKTTNAFSADQWKEDELPTNYYWQCQHYMMCTGLPVWYIAVLIGGNHFDYKAVPRCEADIAALYDAEKQFWMVNVQGRIAPDLDGSDSTVQALGKAYHGGQEEPVDLPEDAAEAVKMLDFLSSKKKELDTTIKAYENRLKEMLGDNEVGLIDGRKVTWKSTKGRVTVDKKKLEKDYPDIYAACIKVGKPCRVFKLSALKGE